MNERMIAKDGFDPLVVRGSLPPANEKLHILNGDSLKVKGKFTGELWRRKSPLVLVNQKILMTDDYDLLGPDPSDYEIESIEFANTVVNSGANSWLGIMFHADTQITSWYSGLVDNAGFSAFNNADTMASHAGWSESTIYAEANRVQWSPGAASGRSITNATAFTFTMNSTGTIHGAFISSDNTKGGTTGTLWAEGAFSSNQSVNNGDLIKLVYTVSV